MTDYFTRACYLCIFLSNSMSSSLSCVLNVCLSTKISYNLVNSKVDLFFDEDLKIIIFEFM